MWGAGSEPENRGPWQQPAGTKNRWRKSPKSQTQLIYVMPGTRPCIYRCTMSEDVTPTKRDAQSGAPSAKT